MNNNITAIMSGRMLTIGGSEAHYLYGFSSRRVNTVVEWIKQKTDFERSRMFIIQCAHGHLFEPIINDIVVKRYNVQNMKSMSNQKITDEESPMFGMSYSPDGIGEIDGETVLFEYKCPFSRLPDKGSKIKKDYLLQILTGFDVLKSINILTAEDPRCIFAEALFDKISADTYIQTINTDIDERDDDDGHSGAIIFWNKSSTNNNDSDDIKCRDNNYDDIDWDEYNIDEIVENIKQCNISTITKNNTHCDDGDDDDGIITIDWHCCRENALLAPGKYNFVDYHMITDQKELYINARDNRKEDIEIEYVYSPEELLTKLLNRHEYVNGVLCWKLRDLRVNDFRRSEVYNNKTAFFGTQKLIPAELQDYDGKSEPSPFHHSQLLRDNKGKFLECLRAAKEYYTKKYATNNNPFGGGRFKKFYDKNDDPDLNTSLKSMLLTS